MTQSLKISEIFYSIQGESTYMGLPCIFIRLSGCNLACSYCDTLYASEVKMIKTIPEVIDALSAYPVKRVEITGGEPLVQKGTPLLVKSLLDLNYTVLMETNGSLNIDWVDQRCIRIMDIKCPDSLESSRMDLDNFKRLTPDDQIKFVISGRKDFEYAKKILNAHSIPLPGDHLLFSPVKDKMDPALLAQWIVDEGLNVRLQLQLHKILWPDIEKGV